MLLTLTLTRADLANYLGMALETVCRLLGTLRRSGIIATDHRTIRLLDFEGLEAVEAGSSLSR